MAAIKASVNLFALLDVNDPGNTRLVDLDSQLKKKPAEEPVYYKPRKKKHGVRVQQQQGGGNYYYKELKEQPGVAVKEASAPPAVQEPAPAHAVKTAPLPPPTIDDTNHFPSLK